MRPNPFPSFLLAFGLTAACLLAALAGFIWLMDPFAFYGSPALPRVNAVKPEVHSHARTAKAAAVARLRPDGLILGSSRTHRGLDPDHPGWTADTVYNLSLPSAEMEEVRHYFLYAHKLRPIRQAVLGAEFFMFNAYYGVNRTFDAGRLRVSAIGPATPNLDVELARSLLSVDSLVAAIRLPRWQAHPIDGTVRANGFRYYALPGHPRGMRRVFTHYGQAHINGLWNKGPGHTYAFQDPKTGRSRFDDLEAVLEVAYRDGVDLRIVISPAHAWELEFLDRSGMWDRFEEWKRRLVRLNEETAERLGKAPFPVWDFSGYNSITAERVPPAGDTRAVMAFYGDPTHFRKIAGDLMLDRVFGYHDPARPVPADFGVRLTRANVERHLARIRRMRSVWRAMFPGDVREIAAIRPSAEGPSAQAATAGARGYPSPSPGVRPVITPASSSSSGVGYHMSSEGVAKVRSTKSGATPASR